MITDYGKGFIYNLILFAKHYGSILYYKHILPETIAYEVWFNGATDHLKELEIPKVWKRKKIGKLAKQFTEKCFKLCNEITPTTKDFMEVFKLLEELAFLVDKELGLKPIKADCR